MNPNAVGHPLTATPAINEFTKRKVTGFATRKKARVEYNEYLNFNPSDLTAIYTFIDGKVMDAVPVISGIIGLFSLAVGTYYCCRSREDTDSNPTVVVYREEDPGDPRNPT